LNSYYPRFEDNLETTNMYAELKILWIDRYCS
jgi:hypothetical protein